MRETRHEETKTRSPGTGIITWLPSRNRRALERNLPLSIIRCPIALARGLATSHGGQGSYRLSGALSEKGTTSATGGGFCFWCSHPRYDRHKKTNMLPYSFFFSGYSCLSEGGGVFEKTHFKIAGGINNLTINQYFTISYAHDQFTVDHAFKVQSVSHHFCSRQYLTGEFNFTDTQCAAFAFATEPAQIKANQLPHCIKAQTARHHRVTDEMTAKEPKIRIDIQFGFHITFAMGAAVFLHLND